MHCERTALLLVQHWMLSVLCDDEKVIASSVIFNLKISLLCFNFQMLSLARCHLSTSLPRGAVIHLQESAQFRHMHSGAAQV